MGGAMQLAERMKPLQANVFADMDRAKARARAAGQTILDLSLGSSDLPADPHVLDAIAASLTDRSTHGYCLFSGTQAWRCVLHRNHRAPPAGRF